MATKLALARMLAGPDEWSRRRLQVLLAIATIVTAALIGGVVWSVVELLHVGTSSGDTRHDAGAEPVGPVLGSDSVDDAQPGPLSTGSTGTLRIPQPTFLGRVQVGTGFPKSARGAVAQLIAIDQRAIESASVVTAQDVVTAWAAAGGPTRETWSGVAAVQTLLESAALPANGSTDIAIRLDPVMALIPDQRPTVCVDFILNASVRGDQPGGIAVSDCQHMVWQDDRWVIAPGEEAASAPSVWPGSSASYAAGYEWLKVEP